MNLKLLKEINLNSEYEKYKAKAGISSKFNHKKGTRARYDDKVRGYARPGTRI